MSSLTDFGGIGCCYCRSHASIMKYMLLLCVFSLSVAGGNSETAGYRLTTCRPVHKAKPPANITALWTETYTFREGESCVRQVVLRNTDSAKVNVTDPRNCQNYYRCEGLSCNQCPCPVGQTFNPNSSRCDNTQADCRCSTTPTASTEQSTVIADATAAPIVLNEPTREVKIITPGAIPADGTTLPPTDSTNGVVIIAVIVVATVIILVALIIGFCLWQRGVFPLKKKPSMHPSNNDGYLHTLPPQERHVYAEIDERTVGREMEIRNSSLSEEEAQKQLQHIYAPPIPSNPPPCVHHPHQTFLLPAGHQHRLYPQFTGYPVQSQPTENRDLMRFSVAKSEGKHNFNQNNNIGIPMNSPSGDQGDNSSVTSCSGCSHCSGLSNQIHLENGEGVDRRTLLRHSNNTPPLAHFSNFVSKQVYI